MSANGEVLSDQIAYNPLMSSPQPLQSIKAAGSKRSSSRESLFGGTLVSPVRKARHVKLPMHATTVTPCIW